MGDGYVMGFSNTTFGELVLDTIGVDVYAPGMDALGSSKANRLRHLIATLPTHRVGVLLTAMLKLEALEGSAWAPVDENLDGPQVPGEVTSILVGLRKFGWCDLRVMPS